MGSNVRKTLGSLRMARAMAMRCFWPPDTCAPVSPAFVSYLQQASWSAQSKRPGAHAALHFKLCVRLIVSAPSQCRTIVLQLCRLAPAGQVGDKGVRIGGSRGSIHLLLCRPRTACRAHKCFRPAVPKVSGSPLPGSIRTCHTVLPLQQSGDTMLQESCGRAQGGAP